MASVFNEVPVDILSLICFGGTLLVFIPAFFGVVIGILYLDRRKHADAWRRLAEQAGLTFNAPSWFLVRPTLSGDWHGRPLRVYTTHRGIPGKTSSTYMHIDMTTRVPQNATITISEQNIFSQLGRTGQVIPIGDVEFDHRFAVRGSPADYVKTVLSSSGLRRLFLQARYINVETDPDLLRYSQLNIETDIDTMMFLFSLLYDLADTIERTQADR